MAGTYRETLLPMVDCGLGAASRAEEEEIVDDLLVESGCVGGRHHEKNDF